MLDELSDFFTNVTNVFKNGEIYKKSRNLLFGAPQKINIFGMWILFIIIIMSIFVIMSLTFALLAGSFTESLMYSGFRLTIAYVTLYCLYYFFGFESLV